MFWKKKVKLPEPLEFGLNSDEKRERFPYRERYCWIHISSKYDEIVFVPMGKIDHWKFREQDSVIVKKWPLNIGELQNTIQLTLDQWLDSVPDVESSNENWHSFNRSKAKTQRSFQTDYVDIRLATDMAREYGQNEVERIIVEASPKNWTDDSYKLIGRDHLIETRIAQLIIDIFKACEKIRTN